MAKGIVSQKKSKTREEYHKYLERMKRGGKSSHKKAKTLYEWMNANASTRQVWKRTSDAN